jgi:hypothetical protein
VNDVPNALRSGISYWRYLLVPLACMSRTPLQAQQGAEAKSVSCDGKRVSAVVIDREPPTVLSTVRPVWLRPVIAVAVQHRTTQPSAIRPFLQVKEGDICSDFRLAESARVLRAQPYIADAIVEAEPDGKGGVTVGVRTVDEVPLVLDGAIRRGQLSRVVYGSSNILGTGMYGDLEWRQGFAYRNGYGVRYVDYHTFNGPNALSVTLQRFPLSANYLIALAHPFYTQFQRAGFYVGGSHTEQYIPFLRPDTSTISVSMHRTQGDVGGVLRLGGPGGRFFAGPLLTYQRIVPGDRGVVITDTGFRGDADTLLTNRYRSQTRTRASALLGVRVLEYKRVLGFDALTGAQDIGEGVQLSTLVGHGILGSGPRESVLGADLYMGGGGERSYIALRTQWETQRQKDLSRWGDIVGSGRLAWYYKGSLSRTLITSVEFSGAWREREPFQLALGDPSSGVRGYEGSRIAGALRGIIRVEQRWVVGSLTRFDNIGVALFSDAGKTWAGQVPYGVSSDLKASLGLGILASVPRESRRLMRVDFAVPVVHDPHAKFQVRATITAPVPGLWREPNDLAQVRAVAPVSGVFTWP